MQTLLPSSLPDFSQVSILVLGDVMLDRYWFGETNRISPEAPVPVVKISGTDNRPGGAGNVALNISALGAKVHLLGITGADEASATLNEQLSATPVTHFLQSDPKVATIIKLRIISRQQQLIRLDFENAYHLVDKSILHKQFAEKLASSNLVVLSDYNKGTLSHVPELIRLANLAGVPVLVDPKGKNYAIYQNATIITPNLKEFEALVGKCKSELALVDKGRRFLAKYRIKALLVTRGEDGMTLIEPHSTTHFSAYAREVFDVTGAGDTVIGVLAASLASGLALDKATALANLAASITVGKLGATSVSHPELKVALTGKTSFSTGIMNEEQILTAVKEAKVQGKKIVFTNGCFDIIHAGHVMSLQMAKELGDFLIVAVNTDESIKKIKGPSRPINSLDHRMTVLSGLGVVDWVIPFADETPERLLHLIKPDLLVKGGDYALEEVVGAEIVRGYGGEVRIMNHNISTSSTAIINEMNQISAARAASLEIQDD